MKNKICILQIIEKALLYIALLCLFAGILFSAFVYVEKKYIYPLKYKEEVFLFADEYQIEKELVFATIKVESGFDKNAKSSKGAVGLMQISPDTAKFIASEIGVQTFDLTNEKTNIHFGCFYLKYLINKFENVKTAIVAFNAGEGNVSRWLQNNETSKDGKSLDFVPFKESREYLKKIEKSMIKYKKLYDKILDKQ